MCISTQLAKYVILCHTMQCSTAIQGILKIYYQALKIRYRNSLRRDIKDYLYMCVYVSYLWKIQLYQLLPVGEKTSASEGRKENFLLS